MAMMLVMVNEKLQEQVIFILCKMNDGLFNLVRLKAQKNVDDIVIFRSSCAGNAGQFCANIQSNGNGAYCRKNKSAVNRPSTKSRYRDKDWNEAFEKVQEFHYLESIVT